MIGPPNADTLSRWLLDSGALPYGNVESISLDLKFETTISTLYFLKAKYTSTSPENLPREIVVKSPLNKSHDVEIDGSEGRFYTGLAPSLAAPPLVRCLASIETGEDAGTLVLEDHRATHDNPPWPFPPTLNQCEAAVDAMARIHAHWWESPGLGLTIGKAHTAESLTSMVEGISANLPGFVDMLGDRMTSEAREIYERVFRSALKPWLRLTDPNALTIVHGDAHTWNFLSPRSNNGPTYLIDWQLWHVDVGARDLAFFMALHWYPSRRKEMERPLLRYYHERLLQYGVDDYSFEDLFLDYRRCVVRNLTMPIIFWSRGIKPEGWWHRLECAIAAYKDLGCDELI